MIPARTASPMNRIDRLFNILLLLQTRKKVRAIDLAEIFEVTERTIYRDMSALLQMGVPIVSQAGEGYTLLEGYFLPPLIFTPAEASAIFLGVHMLAASGNLPQESDAVLEKLTMVLPKRTRQEVTRLANIIHFYLPEGKFDWNNPYIEMLQKAILDCQVIFVRYHSLAEQETTERQVEPLSLTYGNGAWYFAGYCRLREGVRTFRLDRVETLKVLPEKFEKRVIETFPEATDLEIRVKFPAHAARWIRERQHYGFQYEEIQEESVLMVYRVAAISEIKNWLFSWGALAEVLSPPELRELTVEEAKKVISLLT